MPFVKEIRKCNCSMRPSATEAYAFYEPGTTWRCNYCDAVYQIFSLGHGPDNPDLVPAARICIHFGFPPISSESHEVFVK
jgi:hypothetical protein